MAPGDTGGTSGMPTSPIQPMASLEQTPTPPSIIIVGEFLNEGGTEATATPTTKQE